jgi:hypothetical protein
MALLSPSSTNRNMRVDKAQPCLRPLAAVKKDEAASFIRTTKDIVEIQLIIQFVKGRSKP